MVLWQISPSLLSHARIITINNHFFGNKEDPKLIQEYEIKKYVTLTVIIELKISRL